MSTSKGEKLTQVAVVIIAISAVVVSVWQGRISQQQLELTQQHNRLTVKPYLDITRFTNSSTNTYEVIMTNQGYGPAIIKKFELMHNGTAYKNWNAVLRAAGENNNIRYLNNFDSGSVLSSGKEETLIRLQTKSSKKGITIKIIYESIYQDEQELEFTF